MHGLITKNVYDQFDLYRMEGGVFIKTGSFSRHQVLLQMSKGAVFYHVFRVKPLRSGRGCRAPLDFVMTNCVYYHP